MIARLSWEKKQQIFWMATIVLSTLIAIASTVYSLSRGIYEVFPFIYFLPIILVVSFCPRRGVFFSLALSAVYLLLVYVYSGFAPLAVAVSTAWFVVFVTIGVVTSSFASGQREEEEKYREIFENSKEAIFTFDRDSLLLCEVNSSCAQMLKYECGDLIGEDLSRIVPDTETREQFVRQIRENRRIEDLELLLTARDGTMRQFLVSALVTPKNLVICSAIDVTARKLADLVIKSAREDLDRRVNERTVELTRANDEMRAEIEERKRIVAAIQLANHKLNTLSGITRHDILNQTTAMVMYLSLVREKITDPSVTEYLVKMDEVAQLIQKQIRFTRDYQDIGASPPGWQPVGATITSGAKGFLFKDARIDQNVGDLEIYADAGLSKVFANLIENSLIHGEHVTEIRFYYIKTADGLVLCCEDNGVGIPDGAKERIFRREYFRSTGYGLFLIVEILGITGLSIKETGTPGAGARFEIFVPRGSYRFSGITDTLVHTE